jgi:hypothetical protein
MQTPELIDAFRGLSSVVQGTVMTGKRKHLILSVVALCALPAAAQADTILFSENFDTVPLGTNTMDAGPNFNVTSGNVDILSNNLCVPAGPPNHCLDMNGNLGPATLVSSTNMGLQPGEYALLSFQLTGSSVATTTEVMFGNYDQTFNLGPNGEETVFRQRADITAPNQLLTFKSLTPGDAGAILDDVLVVPEPATLGLMVLGLLGGGLARRKRPN